MKYYNFDLNNENGNFQIVDLTDEQKQEQMQKSENQKKQQREQQQNNQGKSDEEDKEKKIEFIIHNIVNTDTLMSLSIQYGVPASKIKVFNKLDSNDIYFLKEIKIPEPKTNVYINQQVDDEELKRQQKIDNFLKYVLQGEDKDKKVAHFYLSEANWDFNEASNLYNEDLNFEKDQKQPSANKQARSNQIGQIPGISFKKPDLLNKKQQ